MKLLLPLLLAAAPAFAAEETAALTAPSAPAAQVEEHLTAPPPDHVEEAAKKVADELAGKKAAAEAKAAEATPEEPKAEESKAEAPKAESAKAEAPAEEPKITVKSPKLEETKPLPAALKPAGEPEEWAFAKAAAEDSDSGVQDAAVDELRLFVRRHPDAAEAPEALSQLAALLQKKGEWQSAAVALLRAVHEFPESKVALRAKSAYLELVDKKASRRQRPGLGDLVSPSDAPGKAERLSALWQRVAAKSADALYEPAAAEIRDFAVRFPSHPDLDKLQAALARLHAANDKPAAAALAWRKLLALYPDSALRPQAQKQIGDLYADALRDPKKAIDAYQDLIASYPDAIEVQAALESSARLFEEKLRQYDLAVEMHEKVVKRFPKTPASLRALKAIARLQRERLSKPDEAIKTLLRLSAMHGGQDGVDALLLAADIARRDLRDSAREAELRVQVSADYAAAKEAPQALYDAAEVYEDDVKDGAKALETYRAVSDKFPSHKLAKKAADRVAKLTATK